MPDVEDPLVTIERLRQEVQATRKSRMSAQKAAAAAPLVGVALDRASRDRSSRSTSETDALREEVVDLWEQTHHEARQVDRVRALFHLADAAYPELPARARIVAELNAEGRWRLSLSGDELAIALRLELPQAEEII